MWKQHYINENIRPGSSIKIEYLELNKEALEIINYAIKMVDDYSVDGDNAINNAKIQFIKLINDKSVNEPSELKLHFFDDEEKIQFKNKNSRYYYFGDNKEEKLKNKLFCITMINMDMNIFDMEVLHNTKLCDLFFS